MTINVLTATYNKGLLTLDALNSIKNQTYTDWVYTILENSTDELTRDIVYQWYKENHDERIQLVMQDFTPEIRKETYIPAYFINRQYLRSQSEYQFWISDDDILDRDAFAVMVEYLQKENHDIGYIRTMVQDQTAEGFEDSFELSFGTTFDKDSSPKGVIDGGAVLFKTDLLHKLEYPYFEEKHVPEISSICDGIFLERIAQFSSIHPIFTERPLLFHRRTKNSTWGKIKNAK